MKAVTVRGPGDLRLEDVPEPTIGEYQVLTEMVTCAICNGTDTKILGGHFPPGARFPSILGHETVGRVIQVGSKVRRYRVGDLVLRSVAVLPGETLGEYVSAFGGMAELGVAVDGQAFNDDHPPREHGRAHRWWPAQQILPADFDPRLGGIFITFKEVLSFSQQLGVGPGRSVLVLGSGPVGFAFARACKILGAHPVVVLGRRDSRLALAAQFGADATINTAREDPVVAIRVLTDGRGAAVVIEGIGSLELLELAPRLVARGGDVGVYGIAPEGRRATFDFSSGGSAGQYSIRFIGPREDAVHDWALHLVRSGAVDLTPFITHEVPLADVRRGFDLLPASDTLKVVVHIER